jgi:tetratricopeptide (TPR) repeat protein
MQEETTYGLLQRGRELLDDGNPAQAALVLERARALEPRKGSILEVLGRAYYQSGRIEHAARRFEEALDIDPTNDYAHYCLGICYLKTRRKEEAAGHFKLAWFLRPGEMYRGKAERFGVRMEEPDLEEAGG